MSIIVDFYGKMSLLELIKQIHKWRDDPFHYNFHEALDLLIETLKKYNFKYAYNVARYIQKRFKEDLHIPMDTSHKLKQIYNYLNKNSSVLLIYFKIKQILIEKGYSKEIEWISNIPNIENIDKKIFFREYVWVVINSGMKNQVAEKIFKEFWIDIQLENKTLNYDVIKHPHKNQAIRKVYNRLDFYFNHFLESRNKLKFLENLPHIAHITKYHLARNLGLDVAKPDRHLVRIANLFNHNDVQKFCKKISELTQDRIGVVDLVFWRFANLNKDYLEILKKWINTD
ncbi:MAG: hypothetical protein ACFFDF_16130 [Candidatus Odinarchaeota archaeon]